MVLKETEEWLKSFTEPFLKEMENSNIPGLAGIIFPSLKGNRNYQFANIGSTYELFGKNVKNSPVVINLWVTDNSQWKQRPIACEYERSIKVIFPVIFTSDTSGWSVTEKLAQRAADGIGVQYDSFGSSVKRLGLSLAEKDVTVRSLVDAASTVLLAASEYKDAVEEIVNIPDMYS
jgi:hypothetical protein